MADLIALPYRASDATFTLVSDATAYFYEAGTSTPLTVYTDSGLGTPRGTSVAADSEGVFAQCWVASGTGVKVDVQDGAGTSLPGFPQDNYPTFSASGTGASSVTFSPVTGNSATDAQTAIANEVARNNTTDNAEALATSGGSGGTFTLTSTYTISAYAAGQVYEFIANQASVGGGSDTLNVDSVGAVVIKKYFGSTSKADLSAGDIAIGDAVRVKHDGTHFVKVSEPSLLDEDDFASNSSANAPTQQSARAFVFSQNPPNAILEDQKSSGTDGGTATLGSWQTRDLNTEARDPDSLVSISSNQFTVSADGWVEWAAPAYQVDQHQTRLYNVTDTAVVAYGTTERAGSAADAHTISFGGAAVVSGKTYRIEHQVSATKATVGYGNAASFSGATEVYTRVKFWRTA